MEHTHIQLLTHKELTGEISPSELSHLNELRADERHRQESIVTKSIWNAAADYEPEVKFDSTMAFSSLMNRIKEDETYTETTSKPEAIVKSINVAPIVDVTPKEETKVFSLSTIAKIAAVFIGVLASYFAYDQFTFSTVESGAVAMEIPMEDGSNVFLAPYSSLKFKKLFKENRKVQLKGKAHFDVARNEDNPFSIATNNLGIAVLGTSFTVDEKAGIVTVTSGRVAVKSDDDDVILSKGQKVMLNNEKLTVQDASLEDRNWYKSPLVFDNAPLDKVIERLNDYYEVNISYKGKRDLSKCRITTNLEGTNLNDALAVIKASLSIEIFIDEADEKKIVLANAKC